MTTTILLVHGGTVTSTMWDPVLEQLHTPARAIDLPGRRYSPADLSKVTRADWVRSVADEVTGLDLDSVVLVGHSSGGYVIPEVAAVCSGAIAHLVFVAATVPADGGRPVDYIKPRLRDLAEAGREVMYGMAEGKTLGGLRPGESPISTSLEIVENDERMGLEAPGPLFEVYSGWSRVPAQLPRTFIRCTQDRVVTADLVERMLPHMGDVKTVDIEAGHGVANEAPRELARLLDQIAASA